MCTYLSEITRTVPLNRQEWLGCIAMGSSTLVISALLKLIPKRFSDKLNFNRFINENEKANNKMLDKYQNIASAAKEVGEADHGDKDDYEKI